jgi:hypothetical protein
MNKTVPQKTQPKTPTEVQIRDFFQTPDYGTDIIVPYIWKAFASQPENVSIWECCSGHDKMVNRFRHHGFEVTGTDLSMGAQYNVLEYVPSFRWDIASTNVPFSIKDDIVARFIDMDVPFAFLMPTDWSQWIINAVDKLGCQLVVPNRRISYITPDMCELVFKKTTLKNARKAKVKVLNKDGEFVLVSKFKELTPDQVEQYAGLRFNTIEEIPKELVAECSSAQFHSGYITRKLGLPEKVNFVELSLKDMRENI